MPCKGGHIWLGWNILHTGDRRTFVPPGSETTNEAVPVSVALLVRTLSLFCCRHRLTAPKVMLLIYNTTRCLNAGCWVCKFISYRVGRLASVVAFGSVRSLPTPLGSVCNRSCNDRTTQSDSSLHGHWTTLPFRQDLQASVLMLILTIIPNVLLISTTFLKSLKMGKSRSQVGGHKREILCQ
jgi:hypothetical protein